ncbi:CBS domain-containing protein [Tepidimicrobium xylanilyticum]|uniref:CBS domain-containing protein n=1 Tax=Tepidimicrobium xylanilyticum TaxID=1123352 RepID=A0A1H2XIL3_9FIRM|nr:CBS domain-containing protein [Tepidimicrobium xylanilyticum]SDW92685.1 CBS domain-containing protein [Tepidimicrobium xylanilyticum]
MEIREIMKSPVIAVFPDETVGKALEIMYRENINGMPVLDKDGNLVGIVVRADIYRFLIDPGHYKSCPVEWVMTKEVVKAYAHEDIKLVAKRLRERDVIALPVMEGDKVVGIVSIEDFVDHFIGISQ